MISSLEQVFHRSSPKDAGPHGSQVRREAGTGPVQSNSRLVHYRERKANLYRYWNRCRYCHHRSRRTATAALKALSSPHGTTMEPLTFNKPRHRLRGHYLRVQVMLASAAR